MSHNIKIKQEVYGVDGKKQKDFDAGETMC